MKVDHYTGTHSENHQSKNELRLLPLTTLFVRVLGEIIPEFLSTFINHRF